MVAIKLVTGDPLIKTISLIKINDAGESTFDIPTATATVTVAVVSKDHARRLTSEITVSSAETGSDWSTSTIVTNISKAETEAIEDFGLALLEIQVKDADEITWFHPVNIIKGQVVFTETIPDGSIIDPFDSSSIIDPFDGVTYIIEA